MQGGSDRADAGRGPAWLDRVTAPDLMLIWPEEQGWAQYIGALLTLDGRSLFDANGGFLIEPVRGAIGRRLHLAPRFRQVLCWPRTGLGWPVWADAPSFDITEHVRVHPVPPPGDERQLLLACETLRRRPLHRGRPLWEMWFLTGLPDQRVGLFIKMHHAIADGVAGVATLAAFVDPIPDPPEISAPAWSPSPLPSTRELFRDNLRRRRRELGRALSALAEPIATARWAVPVSQYTHWIAPPLDRMGAWRLSRSRSCTSISRISAARADRRVRGVRYPHAYGQPGRDEPTVPRGVSRAPIRQRRAVIGRRRAALPQGRQRPGRTALGAGHRACSAVCRHPPQGSR